MTPLDGEGGEHTYWVRDEAPRLVVKIEGRLPAQMAGGTFTTRLVTIED
jgi:hypothetical protein